MNKKHTKLAIILSSLLGLISAATAGPPAQAGNNPGKEASVQPAQKSAPAPQSAAQTRALAEQQKALVYSVKNLREAVKLSQARKWPQAYAAFSKVIKANPDLGIAYADRALTLIAMKRYKEAVADCHKAISLGKDTADVYNRRAVAYMQMKNYDLALADYTKVINLQPASAAAYRDRAYCYARKGDKKNANRDIAMAKKALGGKLSDTNQQQKTSFLAAGGSKIIDLSSLPIDKFDEVIKKDPEHKPIYMLHRATVNMFQGKPQKALEDVDQVLKLTDDQLKKGACPTRNKIMQLRIAALHKVGRNAEAITDCNTVLKQFPEDEQTMLARAMSELEVGRYREAMADADRVKSNPKLAAAAKIVHAKAAQKIKGKGSK